MQAIGELIPNQRRNSDWERISKMSDKELAEYRVELSNMDPGKLNEGDGYECQECLNRGFIWKLEERTGKDGEPVYVEVHSKCDCMKVRASIRRMKRSGLEPLLKRCTFDKYETTEAWQQSIKEKAMEFPKVSEQLENKWFFMGGGVGSGKTHLCTAVAREFLLQGKEVRYMLWVEEVAKLNAAVNDEAVYRKLIEPLKTVDVLYIDDFFKPVRDNRGQEMKPTQGDLKRAYEIIDYRYQHRDLITIISSERHIHELEEIDSAVGSRIYEMTKQNAYNIAKSKERNYRLRNMEVI